MKNFLKNNWDLILMDITIIIISCIGILKSLNDTTSQFLWITMDIPTYRIILHSIFTFIMIFVPVYSGIMTYLNNKKPKLNINQD